MWCAVLPFDISSEVWVMKKFFKKDSYAIGDNDGRRMGFCRGDMICWRSRNAICFSCFDVSLSWRSFSCFVMLTLSKMLAGVIGLRDFWLVTRPKTLEDF